MPNTGSKGTNPTGFAPSALHNSLPGHCVIPCHPHEFLEFLTSGSTRLSSFVCPIRLSTLLASYGLRLDNRQMNPQLVSEILKRHSPRPNCVETTSARSHNQSVTLSNALSAGSFSAYAYAKRGRTAPKKSDFGDAPMTRRSTSTRQLGFVTSSPASGIVPDFAPTDGTREKNGRSHDSRQSRQRKPETGNLLQIDS